ncbi:MAG: hypothetical protein QI199_01325 [Candidatus Korarchaeota archaeon]|nr:hypothetical protein [Candidatus Korarchaeota archaeon]
MARDVAEEIAAYVNQSRERYSEWSYEIGDGLGHAYFDYQGLRWEMWYRGEVGDRSGDGEVRR